LNLASLLISFPIHQRIALLCVDPLLYSSLRAFPRLQLENLIRAFRKRFQVLKEAATIADRILQKHQHDLIEAFLVQHQTGHQSV
jgi:hypothetical protein